MIQKQNHIQETRLNKIPFKVMERIEQPLLFKNLSRLKDILVTSITAGKAKLGNVYTQHSEKTRCYKS